MTLKKYMPLVLSSLTLVVAVAAEKNGDHPRLLMTRQEVELIKQEKDLYTLFRNTFNTVREEIDRSVLEPVEVPLPGEAGGYEHEKHKSNYRQMKKAGILYQVTGDRKYAEFIRSLLLKYAALYPELGAHPLSHNQKPGKLFHQMLNEAVWLVNVSQAYDCVYDYLSKSDRNLIEKNIFKPMVEWFTEHNQHEFDRIHNHGTWAAASVGMIGYVMKNRHYIDMALYGTKKDGEFGFLKQLDLLISPDGYYMEGPYYARYALRPFLLFAEVIERNQPELKIYEYRNQIIKRSFYSAIYSSFPNGVLPPVNDASRTMNIKAPGLVMGAGFIYDQYGSNRDLLSLARFQEEVVLNASGLKLARDVDRTPDIPDFTWKSVEFSDGFDGKRGGLGILRSGAGQDQTMLLMKYGVHGLGHGHFDKLHFIYFDQFREVIPDYGFVRFINIEPKFGGRYLPENNSYGKQTIAHNTVVVDETTQNNYDRDRAEEVSGLRHFFNVEDKNRQVMSAQANDHYKGVEMQRTMFLINDERIDHPVVVDLYRVTSDTEHLYDYPIHYTGHLISTNVAYEASVNNRLPLGNDNGYEHIWKEATAWHDDDLHMTWLDGDRYYSILSSGSENSEVIFGRIGANDPDFNLRPEPMVILRKKAGNHLFASVISTHGYFNEARELSMQARPLIDDINVIGHNDEASVIEVNGKNGLKWQIMVTNQSADPGQTHKVNFGGRSFEWTGDFKILDK